MRSRILAVLEAEPRTVPEIAADWGCPAMRSVFWVMGMRRYGRAAPRSRVSPMRATSATSRSRRTPAMTAAVLDTACCADLKRYGAADVSACFSCWHLYRDLSAGRQRSHLPAADDPLCPGRHA